MNDRLLKRMILETIQETLDEGEDDRRTRMRLKPGEKSKSDTPEQREINKRMSHLMQKGRREGLTPEEDDEYIKLLAKEIEKAKRGHWSR